MMWSVNLTEQTLLSVAVRRLTHLHQPATLIIIMHNYYTLLTLSALRIKTKISSFLLTLHLFYTKHRQQVIDHSTHYQNPSQDIARIY